MKIRIKGNSVRIRLSKLEIDELGKQGFISDKTHFPNGVFEYGLIIRHDIGQIEAEFNTKGIYLHIPQHWADEWIATQRVGFDSRIKLVDDDELYLLIEKDFQCMDNTIEDQSDMYPNPLSEQRS